MGACSQADIPGNMLTFTLACASVASQTAATRPAFVAPAAGTIVSVYTLATTSQASSTNATQALQLVNVGAAGAGTTVLTSVAVTASTATLVPKAWTVVSGNTLAAGDAVTWVHAVGSTGVDQLDRHLVVKYMLT